MMGVEASQYSSRPTRIPSALFGQNPGFVREQLQYFLDYWDMQGFRTGQADCGPRDFKPQFQLDQMTRLQFRVKQACRSPRYIIRTNDNRLGSGIIVACNLWEIICNFHIQERYEMSWQGRHDTWIFKQLPDRQRSRCGRQGMPLSGDNDHIIGMYVRGQEIGRCSGLIERSYRNIDLAILQPGEKLIGGTDPE